MQLTATFASLLAAAQSVAASPFSPTLSNTVAPVPVTKLVCDGDSYKCIAYLDYGDGRWVSQWNTAVYYTSLFGSPDHKDYMEIYSMGPVPVTKLTCDGDTYKCTANLDHGNSNWVAQWGANVFYQGSFMPEVSTLSPVPVTKLACDGDSYKCTAHLDFDDGRWVAQWGTNVFHTSAFS